MTLYGLILAGGQSRRMQQDKSQLQLRNKSLVDLAYDTLHSLCERCYVSVSQQQIDTGVHAHHPTIQDTATVIGPMGGILSAQDRWPEATWMVLACDLPYVTTALLKNLLQARDQAALATLYRLVNDESERSGLQPLCAIYEAASHTLLTQAAAHQRYSLQAAFEGERVHVLESHDAEAFTNLNTRADYATAIEKSSSPGKSN